MHGVWVPFGKGNGPVSRCSYTGCCFVNTRTKTVYLIRYNISTTHCQNYCEDEDESLSVCDDVQFGNILVEFQRNISTLSSLVYSKGEGSRTFRNL